MDVWKKKFLIIIWFIIIIIRCIYLVKIKYFYIIFGCFCEVLFWDVLVVFWVGCCDWLLFWFGFCDWLLFWFGFCDWLEVFFVWDCDWLGVCDLLFFMVILLFFFRVCWEVLFCGGDVLLFFIGDEDFSFFFCRFWKM